MKTLRMYMTVTVFLLVGTIVAQKEKEDKKVVKEVEEVNQTAKDVNKTATNTNDAIKETVESSKETLKTIGSLFGSGKKKDKKDKKNKGDKGNITITVQQVSYDNPHLNTLYTHLSGSKEAKKISKKFSNNTATIHIVSKKSADVLWQNVPKKIQETFKMIEMNDSGIIVHTSESKDGQ